MIDFDGYRPNVGIIICNAQGQALWAKRFGQNSWQFPQGGINEGETPEQAMFRELFEEVGLSPNDVQILAVSKGWLRYKLPKRLIRPDTNPVCIGQKQRWFLLRLTCAESAINLSATKHPEFDGWRWVSYWYPVRQVIAFKRDVYRKVMKEFAPVMIAYALNQNSVPVQSAVRKTKNHKKRPRRWRNEGKGTSAADGTTQRNPRGNE
ncbi:RNA pyrophosphohydrolase [Pasteurellaceae bacterium TAE3-ERU1]|uniref:RNA pyrophosphohydrolase n=1 Tax=Spirabiliibacterium mucosae TaxID=28156 RepID=UPI001AAE0749|nr:RNA pyrophosphohydrolase [Spirabiliibacterium mucosae]MBV7388323.1 RNA pyrophosphohydrolase [Pasteurellaceae bacterium TAE3-ERU1]